MKTPTLTQRKKEYQERIFQALPKCKARDMIEQNILDGCQRIAFNLKKHTLKELWYAKDIVECMAEREEKK